MKIEVKIDTYLQFGKAAVLFWMQNVIMGSVNDININFNV